MKFFYRFRSTNALLGERKELDRQEIYFASPGQLNDPVEGFKDVYWRGDSIVWRNLIRHYLLCLEHAIALAAVAGANYDPEMFRHVSSLLRPISLPNGSGSFIVKSASPSFRQKIFLPFQTCFLLLVGQLDVKNLHSTYKGYMAEQYRA